MITALALLLALGMLVIWLEVADLKRKVAKLDQLILGIEERSPVSLKRVHILQLWFSPEFFAVSLKATPDECRYLDRFFIPSVASAKNRLWPISVTIEEWDSHRRIVLTENFQSRELMTEYLANESPKIHHMDCPELWSTPLIEGQSERLELLLQEVYEDDRRFVLYAIGGRFGSSVVPDGSPKNEFIFLSLPFGGDSKFKRPDEKDKDPENPFSAFDPPGYRSKPWYTCYQSPDDAIGLSWTLWVIDNQMAHDKSMREARQTGSSRGFDGNHVR